MKVLLAETAGFCKGVRRAMTKVLEHSDQTAGPIFTDGPLIHNPQTIDILEKRGVQILKQSDHPTGSDTVFIRTHGVSPERRREIAEMGAFVCDATCPDVARIQGLIRRHRRAGETIVIVGDRRHAEVIGLKGYAEEAGFVIESPEEVSQLPEARKVCVVAQSTLERSVYDRVSRAVKERYPEVEVLDTICPSTYRRQDDIRRLSLEAEAVVVVGGRNSANTRHLVQISEGNGRPTFHVETADELDENSLKRFRRVAVTAGASTPNWILMQVVDRLREIDPEGSSLLLRRLKQLGRFLVKSNLFLALGSAMLCYANSRLMGISLGWLPYAVAFSFILSVHLISHFTDQGNLELKKSRRLSSLHMSSKFFVALAAVAAASALLLAATHGVIPLLVMLSLIALGTVYRMDLPLRIFPVGTRKLSLRLIPASKDLFMALGWSFVTVFFPLLLKNLPFLSPAFFLTFFSTFLLVTVRSLVFDLRDLQGDLIVGRETLPTVIGTKWTKVMVYSMVALQAAIIATGALFGWLSRFGWYMLAVAAYVCVYLILFHRGTIKRETPVEVMGDSQFILAGLLAFFYSMR
ncbi:MAG: 4-hydroxy-3-methylbut-2-enyl diphosphate reductase [Candidatus Glassbacteria bacterium]